jgi:galactokinase
VVALVRTETVGSFARSLARDYGRATGRNTVISVCRASDGAAMEDTRDGG